MKKAWLLIAQIIFLTVSVQGQEQGNAEKYNTRFPGLNASIIGAELAANVIEPGKVKITLQAFYTISASVQETQRVTLVESKTKKPGKLYELKKVSEFIDVKYTPVGNLPHNIPPAVKSVVYSSVIEVGLSGAAYDILWAFPSSTLLINNIDIATSETVALMVHITNAAIASNNNIPMLERLPLIKVDSKIKSSYILNVRENGETDMVDVVLSAPFLVAIPGHGHIDGDQVKQATYRKGFTANLPIAQNFSYNKETKELVFDQAPFGIYVLALTISDNRNGKMLSQHQAVLIIESIL